MVGLPITPDLSTHVWASHVQVQVSTWILSDFTVYAHPIVIYKDVDVMFDDFYNHLVPEEAQSVPAPQPRGNSFVYIQWYFRVSHSTTSNGISEYLILTRNHMFREINLG